MKLLLDDGNQIVLGTGIGNYSKHLYESLRKNGCNVVLSSAIKQSRKNSRLRDRLKYLWLINSKRYQNNISQNYDIVVYTNYAVPFFKNDKTAYVATIHDLASYMHPETLPWLYRIYNRIIIKNTIRNADLIFTVSYSVRQEIINRFPKKKRDIRVCWPGLYDGIKRYEEFGKYEHSSLRDLDKYPFFLFVSTVEKRKNVGMVIEAFIRLRETLPKAEDYKLIIVGRPGYGYDDIKMQAQSSDYGNDIIFTGYTSNNDLNHLYNKAKAFVFPTIYEGFGSTQLECMKCHLPIILSDIPTNHEISRDYGFFFDLNDIETLINQMTIIVNNEYDHTALDALADEYLKEFDWNKIANQYIEYLEELVK